MRTGFRGLLPRGLRGAEQFATVWKAERTHATALFFMCRTCKGGDAAEVRVVVTIYYWEVSPTCYLDPPLV